MTTAREVMQLQAELRAAVSDLVDPIVRKVIREDQTTTTHQAPSLLEQLLEEVGNSSGRPGGARRSAPIPISPEVVDLTRAIDTGAQKLLLRVLVQDRGSAADLVRAAAAVASGWSDAAPLESVIRQVHAWAASIRGLLDRAPRYHVAEPCPACSARMVLVNEAGGEQVQRHTLQVTDETCECLACGELWSGREELNRLAREIDQRRADGVVAAR